MIQGAWYIPMIAVKAFLIGEHIKAWAYKSPWAIKLVQKPGSGQGGSVSSIGNSELRNAFGLK